MRKAILFLLWIFSMTSFSYAQVRVSFTPQSEAVVKKITGGVRSLRGFGVYEVSICNYSGDSRVVHSGAVFQAAQRMKIPTVGPALSAFIFTRVEARHPIAIALEAGQWLSIAASLLMNTQIISARPGWAAGLQIGAQGLKAASDRLQGKVPDFTPIVKTFLDGPISLSPQGCEERVMFSSASGQETVFADVDSLPVKVAQPGPPEPTPPQ